MSCIVCISFTHYDSNIDIRVISYMQAGRTALHYAVTKGNRNVVELLIDAGADIFAKDSVSI